MKRIIQFNLIIILIFISVFSYNFFFKKNNQTKNLAVKEKILEDSDNNIIRNLKYNVDFSNNNKYSIIADTGILSYDNNMEVVEMINPLATIFYDNNTSVTITSDKAIFNSTDYNSFFRENVKIRYSTNFIDADKTDLNFQEKKIIIYENVKYNGPYGQLKSDYINIDLLKKKIQIYMNNNKKNVEIISK